MEDRHEGLYIRFCPFCGTELDEKPIRRESGHFRICFDIDGVLAMEDGDYADRTPYEEALSLLKSLHASGHTLVYCTARYMKFYDGNQEAAIASGYFELKDWLEQHGFPQGEIYLGKPSADFYVDDHAALVRSIRGKRDWDRFFARLGIKE